LLAARQLEAVINSIRNLKRKYPAMVAESASQIHAAVDDDPPELPVEAGVPKNLVLDEGASSVEKMVAWFKDRGNQQSTIAEIASSLGLSEKTVKSIIYSRYKEKFEPTEHRGRHNRAFFRLVEA